MALPNIIQQINSKLPLSGGTITGGINLNNIGSLSIVNGDWVYPALLSNTVSGFYAISGNSPKQAGEFLCRANKDGTNFIDLRGCPDGTLTWGGNNVITSAGGSINGNLSLSNMYCNKFNTSVTWGVGTTWNDAPSISLYGPNETSSSIPNCFSIRAGANSYALTGKPDGSLYWGGRVVLYAKYENGGILRLSNNFTFQWGTAYGSTTVSFPQAFSGTPLVYTTNNNVSDSSCNATTYVTGLTTSYFTTYKIKI